MERCIRCDGELDRGFMIDKGDDNVTNQAQWASGHPKTSFWSMSAVPADSQVLPVVTYRCRGCGRLESYAQVAG